MARCLECGFEAPNIEPHVTKEHGLELYLTKHDVGIEDLVDSVLLEKVGKKIKAKKEAIEEASKFFNLHGKKIAINQEIEGLHTIPTEAYHYFNEDFASIIMDVNKKRNVLLTGHTGCGKTSGITQLAARTKNGVVRVNLNGQTTISDFVGFYQVVGGETVWVDGALPKAMRAGEWLILDEIDMAEAEVLSVLNSVLERNGKLFIKEKGHEVLEAHPNFRIFATANSVGVMSSFRGLYQGTSIMNEAFLDRWQVYHVDYLTQELEVEVLVNSVQGLRKEAAEIIVKVGHLIRESFEKEVITCTFSLRRMLDWADKMIEMGDHMAAAKSTILNKISREEATVIREIIQRVMGGGRGE